MVRNIKKMKASPKAKNMNVAFWNKSPKEVVKTHQKNAEEGKYGGHAKTINEARKKKNKIIDDFLNN